MKATGESLTEAVVNSLEERLKRLSGRRGPVSLRERISDILERVDALPELDSRSAEEIIGYDENGLPR